MIITNFTNTTTFTSSPNKPSLSSIRASISSQESNKDQNLNVNTNRRKTVTAILLAASLSAAASFSDGGAVALAENWGTRSFLKERFFEPDLTPEDAAARIKQTAEGMHSLREMLERMAWRYVIFYVRLKSAYLSEDLKNAMSTLPQGRKKEYVKTANELVDNMAELDYYVRTPKIYESYLFYEKTLKNLDDIVAMLA